MSQRTRDILWFCCTLVALGFVFTLALWDVDNSELMNVLQ